MSSLESLLGGALPTGSGISVTQVEAPTGSGDYSPNTGAFTGKDFVFPNGSPAVSSHATTVGRYAYGPDSLAPQAGTSASGSEIVAYEVNHWLGGGGLNFGVIGNPVPEVETSAVQNHSWVGQSETSSSNVEILRRADYAISRDDYVMVVGVNNGADRHLMSSAYNGISVGVSDGSHATGATSIDGAGRARPHLVTPASQTSWATGTVSGAAALLLEAADGAGHGNALNHEVIKALLLNGATKDEADFSATWSRTPTQPLDPVYGAGELNIERSYLNLMAGEEAASASSLVAADGWDFAEASASESRVYHFEVPADVVSTLTATLTWDREVEEFLGTYSSTLANLDVQLFTTTGFALGSLLDESVSTVDNVEHLFSEGLSEGTYALVISSDTGGQDYGFAWSNDFVSIIPEPSVALLTLLGGVFLGRRRR
ncbi:PEP-CTERM sorting domain-containing protein [Roseibacillus ishigakijimensis]|uniref:PEP-CTERM sorting domain-containing protein n=1 Tax=Roseibacillus ishigakijimensis TaxID=454146 RepID=A0A934RM23_9BACT|nr:PEP-CTERM sorting domain-containing protein [Roseibacillus ishigakijimensis]MBK1833879.1 PEP-CTERM sorting domain-containing protein [Roseibacillus ishigakijimensis]